MSGTVNNSERKPARRVFISQLPRESSEELFWVQGSMVSLGDQICEIDDGSAVVTVHCHHVVAGGTLKWDALQLFSYVLVVGCPFESGLNAIRLIDVSENPNRESSWILETMAQQRGIR